MPSMREPSRPAPRRSLGVARLSSAAARTPAGSGIRTCPATVGPMAALRVAIADDSALMREGVARVLADAGFEVVAQSENAVDLMHAIGSLKPDVAVIDIRMPPTHTDEGVRAARRIREAHPGVGVVVLSQHAEPEYAMELLVGGDGGRRLPAQGPHRRHRRLRRVGAARRAGRLRARSVDRRPAGRAQAPLEPARGAQRARARGAGPDGRGPLQPGHRRRASSSRRARSRSTSRTSSRSSGWAARSRITAACSPCSRSCARAEPRAAQRVRFSAPPDT